MGYYTSQLKALIKRNILLKKVAKVQTLLEIFLPILMVYITYMVNKVSETRIYQEEKPTNVVNMNEMFKQFSYILQGDDSKIPTIGIVLPSQATQDTLIIDKIKENEIFIDSPYQFKTFSDQKDMNEFNNDYHNLLIAGIVFESDDYFHYTLRVNNTAAPEPTAEDMINYVEARFLSEMSGTSEADNYSVLFSPIQLAIDQAIIRLKTKDDTFTMTHSIGHLGKAASQYELSRNGGNLGFYISMMFLMPTIVITISLVKEKEDNIKNGLLMAGTHPTLFWLSWLVLYILICSIISLVVTIIFKVTKTFSNVSPIILFLALLFFGLSCCNFSFVVSTFFEKTKTAGSVIGILVTIFCYANMALPYINLLIRKVVSLVVCQLAIGSFIYEVDELENHFENLSFSNIFTSNAGYFFFALILNNIIYFILAIVFDNLLSNEGSSYIFGFNRNIKNLQAETHTTHEKDIQEDFNAQNGEKCRVEVSHVYKIFSRTQKNDDDSENKGKKDKKNSSFLAVNDVSFKVYENEIFAILGHNGAGKTTLINMMVGLLRASQGNIYFDGLDISKDTNTIRKNFGVCAQTNTIFEELTVEDHLRFYSELKGIPIDIDEVLTEIDLIQQKNLKASKLSGGQKRKLCIGMATLGNPKYIFLDEPTTGLDPLSRRKIWDLLLKKKEGRVIFLTTHYMDEADLLADRKLILSKGKIRCLGTSLFLKNHFNMNYNLDVETKDKDRVHALIQNYLTDFTYVEDPNKRKSYDYDHDNNSNSASSKQNGSLEGVECHTWRLPLNSTSKFPPLLNELENQINGGGGGKDHFIKRYALNMPTLEELFIRLEDHTIDDDKNVTDGNSSNDDNHSGGGDDKDDEEYHCILQWNDTNLPKLKSVEQASRFKLILYLIHSRLKIFVKDKSFAFFSIIFPAIMTGIMFYISQTIFNSDPKETKPRELSVANIYKNTYFNIDPESELDLSKEDFLSGIGGGMEMDRITNLPLNNIPNPKIGETYYLSSIKGRMNEAQWYDFQIHFNDTMTHAIPATLNTISNTILASKNIPERIVLSSHTFARPNDTLAIVGLTMAGLMIGYYISTNISRFGPLVVRERIHQLLQQLQLNGVSRLNYWISCFLTDVILFLITSFLIFIVGIVVQYEPLLDFKILMIIILLLIIWSIPTMLFQYNLNFLFKKEETAFSLMTMLNSYPVLFGYILFLLVNQTFNPVEGIFNGKGIISPSANYFNIAVTLVFPTYGFIAMVNSLFTIKVYQKIIHYDVNLSTIFNFNNGILPLILILMGLAVLYFFLLLFLDRKLNQTNKSDIYELPSTVLQSYETYLAKEADADVYQEFEYVKAHPAELPLNVCHLSKEYKVSLPGNKTKREEIMARDPEHFNFGEIHKSAITGKYVKTAVIDISFGVRNHECFGLLGPNGAGKSTTLNTVTSTIPQTTGKVCFNGVETHLARLGEISMGYCPQNDILWKELTLREHLELFLNIRGYSTKESKEYATQYIHAVGLEDHQTKRADDLSGGTKRKLSLLIAICGYPKQILLDEPSAGMDPSTRRLVWNIIKKTKMMNDSAVIMTTHSMEEAEFLCDRLAILVNGRLSCIGSPEHLKMKFGDSYILEVQSKDTTTFHQQMIENGKLFGDRAYQMEKSSRDRLKYVVKMTSQIGHVFEAMEGCKEQGLVEDYSFNQTTLEQIFINFAKEQIINTE
ncbi:P-loop containing nucleoside triphosphate hydrolase protein [Piromyces finnis]|uniref:p-loop containing nucleoside triphosphate hydrolase protein n=1 Tax=Piromyces finnis TaxID=1754191 RepID=A0A1Y1V8I2_9FUNG|nr:P-loop containing nucleoside triphosphate hydrolase protein [Piromyces finnis]|eukprot:ORX48445.1 P-loop containing nucleoside triphosphate hydrolase protein [Piromyces finnis]